MSPIQQMLLGAGGAVATKTYIDDIFSTYLWEGNATSGRAINNGIDLSTEGGMTWIKRRSSSGGNNCLFDTERGAGELLIANQDAAEYTSTARMSAFNSNGFTIGSDNGTNKANEDFASWTFRKAPGFFDVVTYTGNGSNRTIAHSLGSIPGMIIIKNRDNGFSWRVYHRGMGATKYNQLSYPNSSATSSIHWNDTEPTASVFSLGTESAVNNNGDSFVAYVFAGGESTAATARSVEFDGANDELTCSESYIPNTDSSTNFCLETWVKTDNDGSSWEVIYSQYVGSGAGRMFFGINGNKIELDLDGMSGTFNTGANSVYGGQWYHVAWTFDGTTHRLFLNGELKDTNVPANFSNGIGQSNPRLGGIIHAWSSFDLDGKLSNFRITHGQAVYTSSFRPPTEPLTTTSQGVTGSNCKLLCCNNSTITNNDGSSGTLTVSGGLTASTDSPFDDPAGFVFGDAGDQNVIKCGSVTLPSGETNVAAYLGFEPQWLMFKQSDGTDDWDIYDTMRGWKWNKPGDGSSSAGSIAETLEPNTSDAEANRWQATSLRSTGFHLDGVGSGSKTFIYMAIRRPDGYVGKPPELGTGVFAMDTGAGSSTIPNFDANFPVDFTFLRTPASSSDWFTGARLIGNQTLKTNSTAAESAATAAYWRFDDNKGWNAYNGYDSTYQSWMWKRHAGFDVVTYTGNGATQAQGGQTIKHNLSKTPEMIWLKYRNDTYDWQVYHKGLNGGTNPENYKLQLNDTSAESSNAAWWNNTAPTSTAFTVGDSTRVNYNGGKYIAMLFASVDGISKVGYYTGTSNSNPQTVGFLPRIVLVKRADGTGDWNLVRDFNYSGSHDKRMRLNKTNTQSDDDNWMDVTSTTFNPGVGIGNSIINSNGAEYVYYAHA